ncbi:MAG: Peptidase rane alanine aminopeptidase [Flavipsychrobacter sp.]|nr:Peptidase rane alanine aminopeptidase [Flavipsychrobacter sp.]
MNRLFVFCAFLLIVSSCANRNVGRRVTLDPMVVTGTNKGLDIYRATAPLAWDITHTRVAISFNLAARTADGEAWINLHPYIYPTDTLVLDAKSMEIRSVMLEGADRVSLPFEYKDNRLKIKFGKQYKTQDTIQLYVKYKAMPYAEAAGGSKAISEDRGLYFINTDNAVPNKPVQIWTQGETYITLDAHFRQT